MSANTNLGSLGVYLNKAENLDRQLEKKGKLLKEIADREVKPIQDGHNYFDGLFEQYIPYWAEYFSKIGDNVVAQGGRGYEWFLDETRGLMYAIKNRLKPKIEVIIKQKTAPEQQQLAVYDGILKQIDEKLGKIL